MSALLKPVTANAPAKVKDEGVINLVKEGNAAYNAKSGELLLLPGGALSLRQIKERLAVRLFDEANLQPVDCGSDEAVFSLAERYVRDWGDSALSYLDERGRSFRLLGWSKDISSALQKTAEIMNAIALELEQIYGSARFSFVEEAVQGVRSFSLLCPCEPGSIGARPGLVCRSCGKALLADSPFDFRSPQPGENEPEEDLKEIATPGANTIAELCSQLHLDVKRTLKAMLYVAKGEKETDGLRPVASFIRGDYNISLNKLSCWLQNKYKLSGLRSAEKQELQDFFGEVAGYCGPVGLPESVILVCDNSVRGARNTVAGANRPGYHRAGCCHGRDFAGDIADIAQPGEGSPCACGGSFEATPLRETGSIQFGCDLQSDGCDCKDKTPAPDKKLSYRDREGSHEYPVIWRGVLSAEKILLESGRLR
jgi:prolyl-tRNA synthetase